MGPGEVFVALIVVGLPIMFLMLLGHGRLGIIPLALDMRICSAARAFIAGARGTRCSH